MFEIGLSLAVKKLGNRRVGDTIRPVQDTCKEFCKSFLISVGYPHSIANRHKLKEITNESVSPTMCNNFANRGVSNFFSLSWGFANGRYSTTASDGEFSHRRHTSAWGYLSVTFDRGFGDWRHAMWCHVSD
jgi:hypothetical protein